MTGGINGSRSGDKVDLGITKLDPNYAYFAFQTGTATRTVSGGEKRKYVNLSYFGRASYDYAGKYFAQFTLRADAADLSILCPCDLHTADPGADCGKRYFPVKSSTVPGPSQKNL